MLFFDFAVVMDTLTSAKDTSVDTATGAKDYVKDTLVGAKDSTVNAASKARDKLEEARSSIADKGHGMLSCSIDLFSCVTNFVFCLIFRR